MLTINAIYPEATTPLDAATGQAVAQTIAHLAPFLGATQLVYGEKIPADWQPFLIR